MVCKKSLTTTVPSPSVAKCDLFTRVASGSNKASVFFVAVAKCTEKRWPYIRRFEMASVPSQWASCVSRRMGIQTVTLSRFDKWNTC